MEKLEDISIRHRDVEINRQYFAFIPHYFYLSFHTENDFTNVSVVSACVALWENAEVGLRKQGFRSL